MSGIVRVYKQNNFTIMSNHHLQNPNLSLKAVGLLCKVLALPADSWTISIKGMAAICKEGYESVRTAFKELIDEGYVIRRQVREHGRIAMVIYIARESPDVEVPESVFEQTAEQIRASRMERERKRAAMIAAAVPETEAEKAGEDLIEKEPVSPQGENRPTVSRSAENPVNSTFSPQGGFLNQEILNQENRRQLKTNIYKNNNIYKTTPPPESSVPEKTKVPESSKAPLCPDGQKEEAVAAVKERIDYQKLVQENDKETVQEVVRLLAEYELGRGKYAFMDGEKIPAKELQEKFRNLTVDDVEQVLFSVATTEVKNLRNYLISALFRKVKNDRKAHQMPKAKKNTQTSGYNNIISRYSTTEEINALEQQLLSMQWEGRKNGNSKSTVSP